MQDGTTYRKQGQRMTVRVERTLCVKQGGTAGMILSRQFAGTVFLFLLRLPLVKGAGETLAARLRDCIVVQARRVTDFNSREEL